MAMGFDVCELIRSSMLWLLHPTLLKLHQKLVAVAVAVLLGVRNDGARLLYSCIYTHVLEVCTAAVLVGVLRHASWGARSMLDL